MDFGSAVSFPQRDPDWIKKALIGGVLSIIPIANFIPTGHMLVEADRVARGETQRLPEWSDLGEYFKKGLGVVAISIVYMLPVILLITCGYGLTFGLLMAGGEGGIEDIKGPLNAVLIGVQCVAMVLALVSGLLIPAALTEYITAGRLGAALNVGAVLAEFRARAGQYVLLGLVAFVGSFMAALIGMIACGIGTLFTVPYFNFVYGHLLGQMVAARRIQ